MICSAWGRAVPRFLPQAALQEARGPVSGPSILRPGHGEDHRAGMVPRRPHWGEMTTWHASLLRTDSPANRGRCGQVPPADPGFASSPPAWSWAQSGFLGWAVPMLLPRPPAWAEDPPPVNVDALVSGPLHLTSSHPGVPFHGVSLWKTPPLSSRSCLI